MPLPVVVLEQERVVATNRAAAREGVQPGLRRAGMQALVPHALQLARDPAAEARLVQALALALLALTPHVCLDLADEATVLLEVAEFYEREVDDAVANISALIEP
ncbi:hypothetical protein ACQCQ3_16620, partial [Ralstonia pseudosolanacearum]